jgi:hypothetical protein
MNESLSGPRCRVLVRGTIDPWLNVKSPNPISSPACGVLLPGRVERFALAKDVIIGQMRSKHSIGSERSVVGSYAGKGVLQWPKLNIEKRVKAKHKKR